MMKKNKLVKYLLLFVIILFLGACNTYKQVPFFQDVPEGDSMYSKGIQIPRASYENMKISEGDILQVSIQTKIPQSGIIGNKAEGFINPSGLTLSDWQAVGKLGGASSSGSQVPVYKVNSSGIIDLPLVGEIQVSGKTILEIKEQVKAKAGLYYNDPIVNVRMANFKVTILGEVTSPGTYVLGQGKSSILDALAMAGDLTIYGRRTNILLSRTEGQSQRMVRFNMDSTGVFNSPFFYLKSGDIVYVQPTKEKARANDNYSFRIYSIITSSLSIIISILTRIF